MTRSVVQQQSFADLEFRSQGIVMEGNLQIISEYLDGQDELLEMVAGDLMRGVKNPNRGRNGMNPMQVLRSLLVQRIKNWSFRELRERIADGYTMRIFTGFFSSMVPKHDAFNRAFLRLRSKTFECINEAVVKAAVKYEIEDGRALRVDTTVTETDVHYPTDGNLLFDSLRTLTRLVRKVGKICPRLSQDFPNHTRRAKRRMRVIDRMASRGRKQTLKSEQTLKLKYAELVQLTEKIVALARRVVRNAEGVELSGVMEALLLESLCQEIEQYCKRADQVLDQTRRRVFQDEQVPVQDKIFSIFQPHTDLIKRGKVRKPLEFGHKIFLAESGNGLITDYRVLDGNPSDSDHVAASLEQHQELFGRSPQLYAGDRGFYSPENVKLCQDAGVEIESLPQRGGKRTPERESHEKGKAFRKAQRFRSGIEGRISVLFRGRGMRRCLSKGREGFEAFIGATVLANNLLVIARLIKQRGIVLAQTG